HYVEVEPPRLASPSGDLVRLQEALEREWDLHDLDADLALIRALQPALEAGKYGVTVAVHDRRTITAVWPGLHERIYGVAIDVGSTTIAGHLADLGDGSILASAGVMNPQIRFGEDLMSRVSYAMMNPGGSGEMTTAVRSALNGLLAQLANKAGIKRDAILELAIVGNPIMHHLLLGIDPIPLGSGPFFEGAQISSGQRAAPGAIERVRIDRATLEPRFRVIGSELWSDEPGFAEATAETGITGICGSGIVEVIAELFLAGVITPDGIIDGSVAARTPRVVDEGRTFSYVLHDQAETGRPRIAVTQNDVRAIQLAKAALYAGARLLMDHAAIDTVDEVRLAGAFGSQIDLFHAMVLGLIPDAPLDRVKAAGNAAGTGALIALLSGAARREIEGVVRRVEKIETAVEPRFQEHFVEAMAFPHRTAPSTHLARVP